jgi:S1-C subfamily serine protease
MRRSTVALGLALGSLIAMVTGCADADDARPVEVAGIQAVGCDRPQPRYGVGTFVADGLVLTAAHVVEGNLRDLSVGGTAAEVVTLDLRTDLALVALIDRPDKAGAGSTEWTARMADDVAAGPVRIVGPAGATEVELIRELTLRVDDSSRGITSEREALELDVVVSEGDSGSPVVDAGGRLIGVVVLRRPSTGVTYASAVAPFAERWNRSLEQDGRADWLAPPGACT